MRGNKPAADLLQLRVIGWVARADFHFFHRRGGKNLGEVQVICNIPFLMLREGHEMANQSAPGGWSKILEGLNTF